MAALANRLSETLPAEPLSIADIYALKAKVHPDISPMLGIRPDPREHVIALHVTADSTFHYLGVEQDHGWEILETAPLDEETDIQTVIGNRLDSVMEWAETDYASETFAILHHQFDRGTHNSERSRRHT